MLENLFAQLRAHPRDKAVVLITHRPANVRHADHIYVPRTGAARRPRESQRNP
jgi:ABC-type bacteriocin/lantibiotic exporter with double-glycine peptidase domain